MRTAQRPFNGDAISTSMPGKAAVQLAENIDLVCLSW